MSDVTVVYSGYGAAAYGNGGYGFTNFDTPGINGEVGTYVVSLNVGEAIVQLIGVAGAGEIGSYTVLSENLIQITGVQAAGQVGSYQVTLGALASLIGVEAVGELGFYLIWQPIDDSSGNLWHNVNEEHVNLWQPIDDQNANSWSDLDG